MLNPWRMNLEYYEDDSLQMAWSKYILTGKNELYRKTLEQWADYEKNYAVVDSSSSDSEFVNEALHADKERQDDLLRTTQVVYSLQAGRMVARLREPPELFAMPGSAQQQPAKWPIELEVLPEVVIHIDYKPDAPEPLYNATGFEPTPMARTEENGGRVVFNYEPLLGPFFLRSRIGGNRNGCRVAAVPIESEQDTTLVFESRFESGNLERAIQTGPYEYDLYLRHDLYTSKHTQWYYFRVSNTRANRMYRFTIVNFYKSDSLYNQGMRPLMYSSKDAELRKVGWRRWGGNIKYYRNNLKYETSRGDRPFYSLTWTCVLPHDNDTVYFSHCYPFTYTDQQRYLLDLHNDPVRSRICKQRVLCRTLAGNLVYLLTITSETSSPEEAKSKRALVLSSRVHPGETNASWMMKGFLDYLTGPSPDAKLLRDNFIFKIIPMLNPDGVIVGNYRCSLAGRDLNRNYKSVLKESFPSVWHTKNMVKKLLQEREVVMYCDLHGHSRKQNVFIYGCESRDSSEKRLQERIFPAMLSKNAPDKFHFESCKFKVQKSKEGTGRVVMWNMGIDNSFTMEATFCGSNLEDKDGHHFCSADFEAMGYHFCDTLLDFCDPVDTKLEMIRRELEDRLRHEILIRLQQRGTGVTPSLEDINLDDIDLSDASLSDIESSDGGSDSSISDGLPVHYEYMKAQMAPQKKKKLKSKKELEKKKHESREAAACSQSQAINVAQQQQSQQSAAQKDSRPFSKRIPMRRAASTSNAVTDNRLNTSPSTVNNQNTGATSERNGSQRPNTESNGLTEQLVRKIEETEEPVRVVRNPARNGMTSNASGVRGGLPIKYSYSVQAQPGLHRASAFASTEPTPLVGTENLCPQHEHQLNQHLAATQEMVRHEPESQLPARASTSAAAPDTDRTVVQLQRSVRGATRMVGATGGDSGLRTQRGAAQRQRIDASLPSRMHPIAEPRPVAAPRERPPSGKTEAVGADRKPASAKAAVENERKVVSVETKPKEKQFSSGPAHPAVVPSPESLRYAVQRAVDLPTSSSSSNTSPAAVVTPVPRVASARRASEDNLQLASVLENMIKSQISVTSDSTMHYQSVIPSHSVNTRKVYRRPSVSQMVRESRSDGVEMTNTLASIREIRQSLNNQSRARNISPNTRDHVEQLLAAADREIEQITAGTTNVDSSLQMAGYKFSPNAARIGEPTSASVTASPLDPARRPSPLPKEEVEHQSSISSARQAVHRSPQVAPRRPIPSSMPDGDAPALGIVGSRQDDPELARRSQRMLEQLRGARRNSQQTKTKIGRVKCQDICGKEESLRQRPPQATVSELTLPTKISLVMDDRFGRSTSLVPTNVSVRSAQSNKHAVRNPSLLQSPQRFP